MIPVGICAGIAMRMGRYCILQKVSLYDTPIMVAVAAKKGISKGKTWKRY